MSNYRIFYSPYYYAEIGENHVFPIRKFELVRDKLLAEGTLCESEIIEPLPAKIEDLLLVHTEDYVTRLRAGTLEKKEVRRLGLPWSESLVRRTFLAVSGTINASFHAGIDVFQTILRRFDFRSANIFRAVNNLPLQIRFVHDIEIN